MVGEDGRGESVELLRASAADVLILSLACDAVTTSRRKREVEISVVAPESGGLWGAFARVALPVLFTAIERIIATFARDQVVDMNRVLELLESDDALDDALPIGARIPKYQQGLPCKNGEMLEQDLSSAFEKAGLTPEPTLVRRLVSIKKLRNECAHVHPGSEADRAYLTNGGFSGTAQALGLVDVQKAAETMSDVLRLFSEFWRRDEWSSVRTDLMSDLPIYVNELAKRLRAAHESSGNQ